MPESLESRATDLALLDSGKVHGQVELLPKNDEMDAWPVSEARNYGFIAARAFSVSPAYASNASHRGSEDSPRR